MKIASRRRRLGMMVAWLVATNAWATDFIWTNTATTGHFTNLVVVWDQPSAIPSITSSVWFTNNLTHTVFGSNNAPLYSANVYYSNTTAGAMSVTQAIGNTSWTVIDRYVLGASTVPGAAATVAHTSGTLAVTNAGAAKIIVGLNSAATFTMAGATVLADQLVVDNNSLAATNSYFVFASGNLTTLGASVLLNTNTFGINGKWNMTGGAHLVGFAGNPGTISLGASANNASVEVGPGATLSFTNVSSAGGVVVGDAFGRTGVSLKIGGVGAPAFVTNPVVLFIGRQAGGNNTVTITNATLFSKGITVRSQSSDGGTSNGSNNGLTVLDDTTVDLQASPLIIGNIGNQGSNAFVTIQGGVVTNVTSVTLNGAFAVLAVRDGGKLFSGAVDLGFGGARFTRYNIGGPGDLTFVTNGAIRVGTSQSSGQAGGSFSAMTMTNALLLSGATTIGNAVTGNNHLSNNTAHVLAGATWNLQGNNFTIGSGNSTRTASDNTLVVDQGRLLNVGALIVGAGSNAVGNRALITNGGEVYATTARVGTALTGDNNSLQITDGGLLEANTLSNFFGGAGNTISNVAGIYQFTTGAPVIAPNGFGNIALTGGTISFRAITNANVYANHGSGPLAALAFAGANTFRLNAASNSLAGQTYTFADLSGSGNATNFARLEMINGHTAYRGGDLTIGASGSMLIADTTATITGLFTNQGVLTLANATATFANGVINSGTLRGNGTIIGNVSSAGTNSPGFSVGAITVTGDLTLQSGAVTVMELSGYGAGVGTNDQWIVTGTVTFGGELVVTNLTGFDFAAGQVFQLFDFGSAAGSFDTLSLPALTGGLSWNVSNLAVDGSIAVIPEPTTLGLALVGLFGALLLRRQRS